MSDTISRAAAIDAPVKMVSEGLEWIPVYHIKELPSAEPEIIRCKDCKHWYKDADSGMSCEYTEMSQPEDGFCNWAERRGESDE